MKKLIALMVVGVLLVGVAACGTSGGTGAGEHVETKSRSSTAKPKPSPARSGSKAAVPKAPENNADALKTAVKQYSDAFFNGSGMGAYALLSQRCQAVNDEATFETSVVAAGQQYKGALPVMTSISVNVTGNTGTATYSYDRGDFDQANQPWTFERGGWKYNQC